MQSISNGGTRTHSNRKKWLLNFIDKDKDKDKTKGKDQSALIAHRIGPIFGLVVSSSSEVLESR